MSLKELKSEMSTSAVRGKYSINSLLAEGYSKNLQQSNVLRRADGIYNLFVGHRKHVYKNDRILGSIQGIFSEEEPFPDANKIVSEMGRRTFGTGYDHYAPNYEHFLQKGIPGVIADIDSSLKKYEGDSQKTDFLKAARKTMEAMSVVLCQYADEAQKLGLEKEAQCCRYVATNAPETFSQALQLVFMSYILFIYEERYAMAFGRMDQYLYPYYKADVESGALTKDDAEDIVACALYKLHEHTRFLGYDDVANIAIGGVKPEDGSDAVNELSYIILDAVNDCHIPGPNLSARISKNTDAAFIDACLKVVGTGLGYPAMMNDEANIPALERYGYALEDCRNYCMVGCIENFIQGKQPPWSDGRYNSPKFLELALNDGVDMLTGNRIGPETGTPDKFKTMDEFLAALDEQMRYGAEKYMEFIHGAYSKIKPEDYQSPFLSCFCDGCIEKGLDINMGGSEYPSAHGAACMGIATIADSLAAIEKLVYNDKVMSLEHMTEILKANFEGYEKERSLMLACPKYGNNDDFVDKYAKWFIEEHYKVFSDYRTVDGGPVYIAIASNVQNIDAGHCIAATPDGRLSQSEVSDAASPMHGMDKKGPTAALLSLSKPDYTKSATGTVVNQKYPPSMFEDDEKRKKLGSLIRVYFNHGGQEIQMNTVSRDILYDAMNNPDKYSSMVVRVSGFSAYYTKLLPSVQLDILKRTEHPSI